MYYSEALRHQQENASARSGLAMALAQQAAHAKNAEEFKNAYAMSVEAYKKVLKSEADAHCEVAWVMNMQHKESEALKAYQTALSLEPANARARSEVALLKQKGVTDAPATIVRLTTPMPNTGIAELEPAPARVASEGMSRLQTQRPTLPPLPESDDMVTGDEPNRRK
jgi:tetratricopeptide (TPR) repeat protein